MAVLNRDLAIYMAREAGLPGEIIDEWDHELELMCRLVLHAMDGNSDPRIKHAVIKERNSCAALCEQLGMKGYGTLAAAVAIRNRDKGAEW